MEEGVEGDGSELRGFGSCETPHEPADGRAAGGDDDGSSTCIIGWHIDVLSENLVISCVVVSLRHRTVLMRIRWDYG